MKAQQQTSQKSSEIAPPKPIGRPKKEETTPEQEIKEELESDEEFDAEEVQKPIIKEKTELEKQQEAEMKLLEDNGRFRAELLFQLNELNKVMIVIANILVEHGKR